MPYIKQELRREFDPYIEAIVSELRFETSLPPAANVRMVILRIATQCLVAPLKVDINNRIEILIDELCYHLMRLRNTDMDGNLNYVVTRIVAGSYILPVDKRSRSGWPYLRIARVINVLERAKFDAAVSLLQTPEACDSMVGLFGAVLLEFYNRVAIPKELIACVDNGDVPEYCDQFLLSPLEKFS